MHIADIDGRIYERQKREKHREAIFAAWWAVFIVVALCLLLWGPR